MKKDDKNKKPDIASEEEIAEKKDNEILDEKDAKEEKGKEILDEKDLKKKDDKKKDKKDDKKKADKKDAKGLKAKIKANKGFVIAISIALAVVLIAAGVAVYIIFFSNHKVPGRFNDDELEVPPDALSIIEDGETVRGEDVTAITGATSPDGTVTDNVGITDQNGHKIYSTGQTFNGYTIYTTGKVDSNGKILYTLNEIGTFGQLVYYTGEYKDGKLVLSATAEKPDYTSNSRPNPYKPTQPTTTVTVPLGTQSGVTIKGATRDYIQYYGGKNTDETRAVAPCKSGGYVAAIYSNSYDGDFAGTDKNWAGHSAIVKYSNDGKIEWKYSIGGDNEVWFYDVTELKDGTIIGVGMTMSEDAEPKKLSKSYSAMVVRLKKDGTFMWTYVFPGDETQDGEFIECVEATPDGGFVVGGKATTNGGFFMSSKNSIKAFIFKFDKNCNIKWRRVLSGSMSNNFTSLAVNKDGDIFATCVTVSSDGDFAGMNYVPKAGAKNTVLVKLNKNGDLQWKQYLEGSGNSEYNAVTATNDGGCVVAGYYNVNKKADGIYNSTLGKSDGYVIRYNKDGKVNWARCVGGSGDDYIHGITTIDGGFAIVGRTDSTNGEFRGDKIGGGTDGYILYLNEEGETCKSILFNGSGDDYASDVCTLANGKVAVGGATKSKDAFFHNSEASKASEAYVAIFTAKK